MQRTPFVGHDRHLTVDGLLAAFDHVTSNRTPLWVSLEAPSGAGKTRIVHEFYERLAATRQAETPYWPATIHDDRPEFSNGDVHVVRKQVMPRVKHVPGSLPAYLWWGIGASKHNGVRRFALESDVLTLQQHGPYVDDAWRRIASWNKRNAGWWRNALAAGRDEVVIEAISQIMIATVGSSVPGLGLLGELVRLVRQEREAANARANRLGSSDVIASDQEALTTEVIATVRKISSVGFPVIICVEDFHATNEVMATLLSSLVQGDGSILVITTSWPGASLGNDGLQHSLEQVANRAIRVTSRPLLGVEPFPDGASLAALGPADAEKIVRTAFPRVDARTARDLVERYPNPLALELFCSTRRLRSQFPNGDLTLTPEEVSQSPATLQDLYRDLWRELPELTRLELHLSGIGAPASLGEKASEVRTWLRDLIWDAGANVFAQYRTEESSADGRDEFNPELHDWAVNIGEDLWNFLEPAQYDIAVAESDYLTDSQRREFQEALADLLVSTIRKGRRLSIPKRRYVVDLAAALFTRGLVEKADYEEALKDYLRLADRSPEEAGSALEVLRAWQEAGGAASTDVKSQFSSGALSWSMSLALVRTGNHGEAEAYLRNYVELGYPETLNLKSERELAHALLAECVASRAVIDDHWNEVSSHLNYVINRLGSNHPVAVLFGRRVEKWRDGGSTNPSLLEQVPVGISGRPVFDLENPPQYVVMNAIRENPRHGDERNFVLIREAGVGTFSNELTLQGGKEYEVYTYFHNNAASVLNVADGNIGVARGLRLALDVPTVVQPGERGKISSILAASNSSPREVWNQAYVTTERAVALRYVPGSARIVSGGKVGGSMMSDRHLFSARGTYLGYFKLNGILPGGIDYAGYVIYRLKADVPDFRIKQEATRSGSSDWTKSVAVNGPTRVDVRVTYENTGTTDQDNVTVHAALPVGVEFVSGSCIVLNTTNPSGVRVGDSVHGRGINIGSYGPGASATVTFAAVIGVDLENAPRVLETSVVTKNGMQVDSVEILTE